MSKTATLARGDVVRCGPLFLLLWDRPRGHSVLAFPVLAQTRPLTRLDLRIPRADLADLGLQPGLAWLISLQPCRLKHAVLTRIGSASPRFLRDLGMQMRRGLASELMEAQTAPAWS